MMYENLSVFERALARFGDKRDLSLVLKYPVRLLQKKHIK